MASHYETLGVEATATEQEIRSAFRAAAKASHPDLHPDDPSAADRFKAAAAAWEVLSDPAERQRYDETLRAPPPPPPAARPAPEAGQPWVSPAVARCVRCREPVSGARVRCDPCERQEQQRVQGVRAEAWEARRRFPAGRSARTRQQQIEDEARYGWLGWWGPDGLPRW